jgi:hypothetical protein
MEQELEERIEYFLKTSKQPHINLALRVSSMSESINVYEFMVLKRSASLVFGFATMLRERNFLCAVPLIRLQIDNLLRFRAAFLVDNQNKFVEDVIGGKEVRQLSDRLGNKMHDAYLQDVLSESYPWLKNIYKTSSSYIHLSDTHFLNTIRLSKSGPEGTIEGYIGPDDQLVSNQDYAQAVEDMILISNSLLMFIDDWITNKNQLRN